METCKECPNNLYSVGGVGICSECPAGTAVNSEQTQCGKILHLTTLKRSAAQFVLCIKTVRN